MNNLVMVAAGMAVGGLIALFLFGVRRPRYIGPTDGDDDVLKVRSDLLWSHSIAGAFALGGAYHIVCTGAGLLHWPLLAGVLGFLLGRVWGWRRFRQLRVVDLSGPDAAALPESGLPTETWVAPPLPILADIGIVVSLQGLGLALGYAVLRLFPG